MFVSIDKRKVGGGDEKDPATTTVAPEGSVMVSVGDPETTGLPGLLKVTTVSAMDGVAIHLMTIVIAPTLSVLEKTGHELALAGPR